SSRRRHTRFSRDWSSDVCSSDLAVNVAELGYEEHGSYIAIFKHMNLDYMWEKVRVQGGAYGGRAEYNPREGVVGFLSWRDPNLRSEERRVGKVGCWRRRGVG